jgi:hypothetical protein
MVLGLKNMLIFAFVVKYKPKVALAMGEGGGDTKC